MRLIDADALYERACSLEAQALDYVGKIIERDGDEPSVEWKVWSAILTERTAFKHDVFDAPSVQPKLIKAKIGHEPTVDETEILKKMLLGEPIVLLPSPLPEIIMPLEPERKKGTWVYGEDEYGIDGYHCDKCGFFVPWDYTHTFINYIEDYHFCPNCGADMRGEEHEAD